MILKPSWVSVRYRTKGGTLKSRLWNSFDDRTSERYKKAVLQNLTLEETARLFLPKGVMFSKWDEREYIVFSFDLMLKIYYSPYRDRNITVSTNGIVIKPFGNNDVVNISAFSPTDRMDKILRVARSYCFVKE